MQVNGVEASTGAIDQIQNQLRVNRQEKSEVAEVKRATQVDTVDISEAGRQKAIKEKISSASTQKGEGDLGDNSQHQSDAGSDSAQVSANVDADKLEQSLTKKKNEVTAKQAKLNAAKRAAENDPTQAGEVKKLQSQVSSLET